MSTKEKIEDLIRRAYFLDAIPEWSESVEESYWVIKEELFDLLRLRSYTAILPPPPAMQKDLDELNAILETIWRKQFA